MFGINIASLIDHFLSSFTKTRNKAFYFFNEIDIIWNKEKELHGKKACLDLGKWTYLLQFWRMVMLNTKLYNIASFSESRAFTEAFFTTVSSTSPTSSILMCSTIYMSEIRVSSFISYDWSAPTWNAKACFFKILKVWIWKEVSDLFKNILEMERPKVPNINK